jgi:hypothetical protein
MNRVIRIDSGRLGAHNRPTTRVIGPGHRTILREVSCHHDSSRHRIRDLVFALSRQAGGPRQLDARNDRASHNGRLASNRRRLRPVRRRRDAGTSPRRALLVAPDVASSGVEVGRLMKDHDQQVAIPAVRDAYLRAEFERCISLCDVLETRREHDDVEAGLLRARALIPLGRADRALDALRRLPQGDIGRDETLVKKMLTGMAYSRLGQLDRGVELLLETRAHSQGAHPTVQADIAVNLGVAWYLSREFARAADVLQSVPDDADILHYSGENSNERSGLGMGNGAGYRQRN